jgi:hypothetical protein
VITPVIYNGHYGHTDDLAAMVRRSCAALRPHLLRFDFIAVSGMSGALVGAPVSVRLHRPLVVVRKPGDTSHAGIDLVGEGNAKGRYVLLDDFISFGHTYTRIRTRMERSSDVGPVCRYAGVYLYSDGLLSWDGDEIVSWHPDRIDDWTQVDVCRGKLFRDSDEQPAAAA